MKEHCVKESSKDEKFPNNPKGLTTMRENPIICGVAEAITKCCSPVCIYLATRKQNTRGELTAFKLLVVVNDVKNVTKIESDIYMSVDCEIPYDVIVYNNSVWENLIDDYGTFAHKVYESGDKLYG